VQGKRVKFVYDPRKVSNDSLEVEGVGYAELLDSDHAYAPFEILRDANLSSLRAAMSSVYAGYEYGNTEDPMKEYPRFKVNWTMDPVADFDEDDSLSTPVSIVLMRDRRLLIEITVPNGPLVRTDNQTWAEGQAILDDWLSSRKGKLVSLLPYSLDYRDLWTARIEIPLRNKTLADAYYLGDEAIEVIEAFGTGELTVEAIVGLLKGGHASALTGSPETQLLEAKVAIRLETDREKLELSKDVSALANAASGGVLVVGLETQTRKGRDIIWSVRPIADTGQVRQVRAVLHRHIYPPIQGLRVAMVPAGSRFGTDEHLLMIVVPAQPKELTPFIVAGVAIDGNVLGNYVGVFERREDDVTALTAPSIQAGLAAGFALLRGESASVQKRQ